MRWRSALGRFITVTARWLIIWLLIVALGFVGLRFATGESRATFAAWPGMFLHYLGQLVRGDWGISASSGHAVSEMVAAGLPVDLLLGGGALLAASMVGAPWGLLAAAYANRTLDVWLMRLARGLVAVSVVALMPAAGLLVSSTERWSMVVGGALWLPMLALALPYAAQIARETRHNAVATLVSEAVFMARAKGLPRRWIWFRYVAPAARLPFLTLGRPPLVSVLTGVIVIENLAGVPGMGRYFISAAHQQDYPLIVGLGIVYSTVVLLANLGADLLRSAEPALLPSYTVPRDLA